MAEIIYVCMAILLIPLSIDLLTDKCEACGKRGFNLEIKGGKFVDTGVRWLYYHKECSNQYEVRSD